MYLGLLPPNIDDQNSNIFLSQVIHSQLKTLDYSIWAWYTYQGFYQSKPNIYEAQVNGFGQLT